MRQLGRDFGHLTDEGNLLVLAGGGAARLAVRSHDHGVTKTFESSPALDRFLELGTVGGGGLVQVGGAIATHVVGRATRNPEVRSLGYDLIRAQMVSGVLTQGPKLAVGRTRPNGVEGGAPGLCVRRVRGGFASSGEQALPECRSIRVGPWDRGWAQRHGWPRPRPGRSRAAGRS